MNYNTNQPLTMMMKLNLSDGKKNFISMEYRTVRSLLVMYNQDVCKVIHIMVR